jgi:hypothetical protein
MRLRPIARIATAALIVGALLFPARASAQHLTFGAEGGLNIANVNLTTSDSTITFSPDSRKGAAVGVFLGGDFVPYLGVIVEALYSQKGATVNITSSAFPGFKQSSEVKVGYIEVPLLVRANVPASSNVIVHLFAGPSFAWKVHDSVSTTTTDPSGSVTTESDDVSVRKFDSGIVGGVGIHIHHFLIDGRYTWGLININKDSGGDEPEIKTRTFSLLFGYEF